MNKKLTSEQIKKFKDELQKINEFDQIQDIANEIVSFGDTEWAKKIYIKALKKAAASEITCFQNAHKFLEIICSNGLSFRGTVEGKDDLIKEFHTYLTDK
tara:strand:- start:366 stop:665 length:300 start_codon:yes stop_codon:yes gene_type:complete